MVSEPLKLAQVVSEMNNYKRSILGLVRLTAPGQGNSHQKTSQSCSLEGIITF